MWKPSWDIGSLWNLNNLSPCKLKNHGDCNCSTLERKLNMPLALAQVGLMRSKLQISRCYETKPVLETQSSGVVKDAEEEKSDNVRAPGDVTVRHIREFKIRRPRTTNYGWTSVVLCL